MSQNQNRPPQQMQRNMQNRRLPQNGPNFRRPSPYQAPMRQGLGPSNGANGGMIGRLVSGAVKNPIDTIGKVVNIIKILK